MKKSIPMAILCILLTAILAFGGISAGAEESEGMPIE